ncbi:hypothetical protein MKX03_012506 [Papaver bracteatum]|nr:hypothetical protein MKX03_012506 [Papaver bracteatum]
MAAVFQTWFLLILFTFPFHNLLGFPTTLTLERAFPLNKRVELNELRVRDKARHGRILQQQEESLNSVINFNVYGSSDPELFGLYFTRVKIGSPPREFHVQIDTGSDVLWVACDSCDNCPKSTGLDIQLGFFDPYSSSSAAVIPCSSDTCSFAIRTAVSGCPTPSSPCRYSFLYGDNSGTSGYYVSDILYLDTVVGDSMANSSASRVVFGCSNYQSGGLTRSNRAIDGIIGFGQHYFSVISQLSSGGTVPKMFSHCLNGKDYGGGVLVLGEILAPGIIYSPLVQSQRHYNLNLLSIAVSDQIVPINPDVFVASSSGLRGTIVDSGTTLVYLAEEAYDPFVNSVANAVSLFTHPIPSDETVCFPISSSVDEIFPPVTLFFEGDAPMVLKPRDYLVQRHYTDGGAEWCLGFQKGQGLTILGDLVLKDKVIIYDLARQRLGWVNYDCSSPVNVSSTTSKDSVTGERRVSNSPRASLFKLTTSITLYILLFTIWFLLLSPQH